MQFKALISAIAITSALTLSGGAYAQMMINGVEITDEDELASIQERCDQLSITSTTESLVDDSAEDSNGMMTDDGTDSAGEADVTIDDAPDVNEIEESTTSIDLDTLDLEACEAAGL